MPWPLDHSARLLDRVPWFDWSRTFADVDSCGSPTGHPAPSRIGTMALYYWRTYNGSPLLNQACIDKGGLRPFLRSR
jgi:hypothetical protein